jgi:hypothetical protein
MRRIGGRLGSVPSGACGADVEIPPLVCFAPNLHRYPVWGKRLVGSLTGAVASQRVTEAHKGPLRLNGNQPS